jgi:HSP20 family protein
MEFQDGVLTLEGEVEHIAAKKLSMTLAVGVRGVRWRSSTPGTCSASTRSSTGWKCGPDGSPPGSGASGPDHNNHLQQHNQGGERMAKGKQKSRESKEVAVRTPSEVLPQWGEIDRWFDRLTQDFWRRPFPSLLGDRWQLPMLSMKTPSLDVFEEKDEVVVKADLPGLTKDEIEVTVTGDVVTIKGEKKKEEEVKEKDYYRRERAYGSFVRSVELPCEVKSDRIKASFKDGVLEVRMPKTEEAKKKAVSIKID